MKQNTIDLRKKLQTDLQILLPIVSLEPLEYEHKYFINDNFLSLKIFEDKDVSNELERFALNIFIDENLIEIEYKNLTRNPDMNLYSHRIENNISEYYKLISVVSLFLNK